MLRAELNMVMDALRGVLGSPGLPSSSTVRHLRGVIGINSDYLMAHESYYHVIGTAFSIPVVWVPLIEPGIWEYMDDEGNLLATNA